MSCQSFAVLFQLEASSDWKRKPIFNGDLDRPSLIGNAPKNRARMEHMRHVDQAGQNDPKGSCLPGMPVQRLA